MKLTATIFAAAATSSAFAFAPTFIQPAVRTSTRLHFGSILDTLRTLEGPGQVWGADGIAVGKEESDFKEFDNFNLLVDRIESTGVAANIQGAGPFTLFAPTNSAIESYETTKGPVTADVLAKHVLLSSVPSSALSAADLTTAAGTKLTYGRRFRKDFVEDAIIGEKTFGPFSDYPTDVAASNGIIHSIGLVLGASD